MYEQIPGISDQHPRKNSAASNQIDEREARPYLPKNRQNRFVRTRVMQPMPYWCEIVKEEAMDGIFANGQYKDTDDE
jgi:hypothetical protein